MEILVISYKQPALAKTRHRINELHNGTREFAESWCMRRPPSFTSFSSWDPI